MTVSSPSPQSDDSLRLLSGDLTGDLSGNLSGSLPGDLSGNLSGDPAHDNSERSILWNTYKDYLTRRYGFPVYRIGVDGGFSCPNRDSDRRGGCLFCDALGSSASYARRGESSFTRRSGFLINPPQKDSGFAGLGLKDRLASIDGQIDRGKEFIRKRYGSDRFSLYFQAYSNTYDTIENLRTIYQSALRKGPFYELIISTRPDCLSPDVLELLTSLKTEVHELWVEIGLESGSDRILALMNRGHDNACFKDSARRCAKSGINVCAHVIIGFPSETMEEKDMTIDVLDSSCVRAVKLHNLHITSQSRLLDEYFRGEITAASLERHVHDTMYFLRRLRPDIIIERLMCETPAHRLAAPRSFPDKTGFLKALETAMKASGAVQGDMWRKP